jgi:erythromycin esterase-like protein
MRDVALIEAIRSTSSPIGDETHAWDDLIDLVRDARFVLLGEASHGTHEFYRARSEITRRLVTELGFNVIAAEADWPDAYRANRWVRGLGEDRSPIEALSDFRRFPTWMWRNTDVVALIDWLAEHNRGIGDEKLRTGFYGIDLYSLFTSIEAVLGYLDKVDPEAARRARDRYSCFERFAEDSQAYGYAASFGVAEPCEDDVVAQLLEFRSKVAQYASRNGTIPPDEAFFAEQNARLVKNAEQYYRSMFHGRVSSWNLRDEHMTETIAALSEHIGRRAGQAKVVVWAHNSHLGDAGATEMGRRGETNVGGLMRNRFGDQVRSIGFTTYDGTVTAASDWDAPAELKHVRPAMDGSYELLFHQVGVPAFWLPLRGNRAVAGLAEERLERAIGVIYAPRTERASHYFHASLPNQFDGIIHFDTTRAVEPLERWPRAEGRDADETWPWAL